MPSVVGAIVKGIELLAIAFVTAGPVVKSLLTVAGLFVLDFATRKLLQRDIGTSPSTRDVMVRGTTEPRKILYGQDAVSGPIVYINAGGTDNKELAMVVALTGHECDSVVSVMLDNDEILAADIDWPSSGGLVTAGKYTDVARLRTHLGTDGQAVDGYINTLFSTDWTTNHRLRGICYIACVFELVDGSEDVWEGGPPSNIRVLLKGKNDVYDPRLDASPGANPDNATYQAWTDNPALCLADYLTDTKNGAGWAHSKIDYDMVDAAADVCDELVSIPPSSPATTQKRYTCNGVLFTSDNHRENISKLLSSMAGRITYRQGKWRIQAGDWDAPDVSDTLDENDLRGPLQVQPKVPANDRYNTVRGRYIDPDRSYQLSEFLEVTNATYVSRDNGETLYRDIELPMTNDEYMAQRIAMLVLDQSDQMAKVIAPCNYRAVRFAVGQTITVDVDDFTWSAKTFRVMGWRFGETEGVDLILREDNSTVYADPLVGDYGVRTAAGDIVFPDSGVPAPSSLSCSGEPGGNLLTWTNPTPAGTWNFVEVYASTDDQWANAVWVGNSISGEFFHRLGPNELRYYWVRAVNQYGQLSIRDPDSDTSTCSATAEESKTTIGLTDPTFDKTDATASPDDETYWDLSVTAGASADFTNNGGENNSNAVNLSCPDADEQAWLFTTDRVVISGSGTFQIRLRYRINSWQAAGNGNKPSIYVGGRYYADLAAAGSDTGTTLMTRLTTEDLQGIAGLRPARGTMRTSISRGKTW